LATINAFKISPFGQASFSHRSAMSTTLPPVTAEQLWDAPHDGLRRELVRGEIIAMNPSGAEHGQIVVEITWRIAQHVREKNLGVVFGAETGFALARHPDTVRAPDVAFVRKSRIAEIGVPKQFFPGAPDLAVEVVSPSERPGDIDSKVSDWLAHGTLSVWLVNPQRRVVAIYRPGASAVLLGEGDVLEEPDLLPGFKVAVKQIWNP
jgi:Uma2 family endonuclease